MLRVAGLGFTETNEQQRRDLETRQVSTTLSASNSKTHTRSHTANVEAHIEGGYEPGAGGRGKGFGFVGFTAGYTFQSTDESATSSQREYQNSLSTDREVTSGFNVERQVQGATMQVGLSLRNVSNLAYRVKNLQVTAFIQDPLDRTRLTPIATLLPDSEPAEGFTLGALVTSKGPFVFTNSTIVPTLVESLMANSAGLIFRIANYDVIDEAGRNFAFTSQEVVERTSAMVLDFGGARSLVAQVGGEPVNENLPGDETEIHRVAVTSGRAIADTNGDGRVDRDPRELFDAGGASLGFDRNGDGLVSAADGTYVPDTRVVFDGAGKGVGVSLHEAFAAAGLTRYVEATTPTANLTDDQVLNSYSVFIDGSGREKIFRIRGVANDALNRKFWEVLTPLGVDASADLNALTLKANAPVSLNFVQDLDADGLTADVEFFLRTSDSPELIDGAPKGRDTDRDGLDDRFESLVGWTVTTPQRTYKVWSSPNRGDSNFDTLTDLFTAPAGWVDRDGDGLRDRLNEVSQVPPQNGVPDYVLDPIRLDTDGDGINDAEELAGFDIRRITDGSTIFRRTDPTNRDTDFDTFSDGFEKRVGLDPTSGADVDTDGDGLPDPVELAGWRVVTVEKSTSPYVNPIAQSVVRTSLTNDPDSDDDGLTDFEEFFLGTNARAADTDADDINDLIELRGFALPHKVGGADLGIIKTDPLDADTDNDKRPDGAEAELKDVELARWVVRPDGRAPYRVFSNPLVADADFDALVDGDEIAFGTDPHNGNTDGDKRDDGKEFTAGTNPLVEDFQVTVVYSSFTITRDGDEGGAGPGDFGFDLGFRRPDSSRPTGLSSQFTSLLKANANLMGPFRYGLDGPGDPQVSPTEAALPALDAGQTQQSLRNNGPSIYGINMDDGATLNFARLLPENSRSRSFGMTKNDFFAVEGVLVELDGFSDDDNPLNDSLTSVYLGGLEGVRAEEKAKDEAGNDVTNTIRPVFYGADLLADPRRFRDLTFTFKASDNQTVGSNPGVIEGSVSMYIIVS